jgi:hypothetical protein
VTAPAPQRSSIPWSVRGDAVANAVRADFFGTAADAECVTAAPPRTTHAPTRNTPLKPL